MVHQIYPTYESYRQAWDNAHLITPSIPLNIDIELASVCNLRCPFCFWSNNDFRKKIKPNFMDVNLAKKIILEAAHIGVPALKFNWRGESTMHMYFSEIMQLAYNLSSFHDLIVNTNGNCNGDSIKGLMYANKIIISIDTFNEEKYKKLRFKGNLERVISTIKELLKRHHKGIILRRIITQDNEDENFRQDVKDMFSDWVGVSEHCCFERGNQEQQKGEIERMYCGYPSQRLMISSLGNVYPCCVDYMETLSVGNILNQPILEIWNGKKIENLRQELKRNDFHNNVCRNCNSWMAYKCENREFVKT